MRGGGLLVAIVALLLIGGAVRLAYIETSRGDTLRSRAARQQTTRQSIPALRGEILDTRGRVLAGTVRSPSVYVDPALVADPRYAACSLAPILGLEAGELEDLLREPPRPRFVWLKRGISGEDLEAFEKVVGRWHLPGFGVQYEVARVYPQGRLAPHVLGFVGVDLVEATEITPAYEDLRGLAGVEEAFNDLLTGKPGKRTATVDVIRRRVCSRKAEYEPAVDGATIVLTIDAFIQQITQEALAEAFKEHEPEWAAAVVLDPQSGEVLAMATIPDFDPAAPFPAGYHDATEEERERAQTTWRNRAVADSYEPGSIFKPFVASCALDEGVVALDDVFTINGPERSFGRRTIHDTHAYKSLAVHEIISKSSNIGMGLVGARCGMERLNRYVRLFGFGEVTGVGLPGEHSGLVQAFSRWNPSFSPQSIPIGQEISVTPIQIVTAFSVFCNGGVLPQPRIVRGVIGPDGDTLQDCSRPVEVRRVLSEETAEAFRWEALVEAVEKGTGKRAAVPGYQVFGKTGTAQVAGLDEEGKMRYLPGDYVGSFVGGAPADYPRVVVLVSLYKPSAGKYYGGTVAAPAVKEILEKTLAYMRVPPDLPESVARK